MKVAVATSDRCDRRLTPHTPWPLVQPLPMPRSEPDQQAGDDQHRPGAELGRLKSGDARHE